MGIEVKRSGVAGVRVTSAFIANSGQRRKQRAEERGYRSHAAFVLQNETLFELSATAANSPSRN